MTGVMWCRRRTPGLVVVAPVRWVRTRLWGVSVAMVGLERRAASAEHLSSTRAAAAHGVLRRRVLPVLVEVEQEQPTSRQEMLVRMVLAVAVEPVSAATAATESSS